MLQEPARHFGSGGRGTPGACLACLLGLTSAANTLAQPHQDVTPIVVEGRIVTGRQDFEQPGNPVIPDVRVFPGFFGEVENGTDDPGFSAPGNTVGDPRPFPAGTLLAFDIMDALRKWDGADFDSIPAETMTVSLGANARTTPTMAGTMVAGFNFVAAGSTGGFHQHTNLFLDEPFSTGVYLLTLRLRCNWAGAAPSEPFYFVMNQNDTPENADAAANYVRDVILAPPACPGDADGSGAVNFADVLSVLANFGGSGPAGDANHNGFVDFSDVLTVLANFNAICP